MVGEPLWGPGLTLKGWVWIVGQMPGAPMGGCITMKPPAQGGQATLGQRQRGETRTHFTSVAAQGRAGLHWLRN